MILPNVMLRRRCNQHYATLGIDTFLNCKNKWRFVTYPYRLDYQFNSRGFRDQEWPDDLAGSTWCLGDSFTMGIGAPFEHTWPQLLEQRTINVSMDGASNSWISRMAVDILQQVRPRSMIIMWSFLERRELVDTQIDDLDRRQPPQLLGEHEHFDHFLQCYRAVEKNRASSRVIHAMVPGHYPVNQNTAKTIWGRIADPSWGPCPETDSDLNHLDASIRQDLQDVHKCWHTLQSAIAYQGMYQQLENCVGEIEQLDTTRDGFHFDIKTAENFVTVLVDLID